MDDKRTLLFLLLLAAIVVLSAKGSDAISELMPHIFSEASADDE